MIAYHIEESFSDFMVESDLREAPLTKAQRRDFGLPDLEKYPMPDRRHVFLAIAYFNHCKPWNEEELARNIIKYMKKFKITHVNLSPRNRFGKYWNEKKMAASL